MDPNDRKWFEDALGAKADRFTVLDPTAGGGSIPFEALRAGLRAGANDLNPVAAFIMRATVEWPSRYGDALQSEFEALSRRFVETREKRLSPLFPPEPTPDAVSTNFLWARTVVCPYCDGLAPLSPNWRLAPDGTGVRLRPEVGALKDPRRCSFEIVGSAEEQSPPTTARGAATCPFPDCGRVIEGAEIKKQAREGRMGEQLYAVVYKRRVSADTKTGKTRWKWERPLPDAPPRGR